MPTIQKPPQRHLAGAMLMILGMLVFPVGDIAAKFLSSSYSTLLLSWMRFAIGTVTLLPLAFLMKTEPVQISKRLLFEQLLRAMLIVAATVLFIAAIAEIPLADTVGAYFTAPIIAVILAVFILKEKFSAAKIIATTLGFVGMLLIVHPGASMEIGFVYALAAGACFGSFLVATQWSICEVSPIKVVAFQTLFGTVILLPFIAVEIEALRFSDASWFLLIGLASAIANILTITALRLAPASLLAPLVYVEIIGATLFGYLVFDDVPSLLTLAGIAVVVLGGLMLIERRASS